MGFFDQFKKRPPLDQDLDKAKDWAAVTMHHMGYQIDFTMDSLKEVDRLFNEEIGKENGFFSEKLGTKLFSVGAYIGDVLIGEYGGRWMINDRDKARATNVAVRLDNGATACPVLAAIKRYEEGPEHAVYPYLMSLIENAEK